MENQGGRLRPGQAQPQCPPHIATAASWASATAAGATTSAAGARAREVAAEDDGGVSTAAGHHGGNVVGRGEKDHDSREGHGTHGDGERFKLLGPLV